MPLLETLPEPVENTLRALRAGSEQLPETVSGTLPARTGSGLAASDQADKAAGTLADGAQNGDRNLFPIALETDINARGIYGTEWLVVDAERVYVLAPNGGERAELRHAVPLRHIREARAEMHVGVGTIEVRTEEETIRLLRFSHALVGDANTVARQINALATGGETSPAKPPDGQKKFCPNCKRPLPEDSEVCPACMNKRAVMLRLFRFLAPYRAQVILSILLIVAMTATELAPPWIAGRIVDVLVEPRSGPERDMRPLIYLVLGLAATRFMVAGLLYGQRRLNPWLGGRVLMDIRIALFDKFNLLSLAYYDKRTVGSVMSRVTNDADNLWDFLIDGAPWLVSNLLILLGTGLVLFRMNAQLALCVLAPGPFIFLLTRWFMPRARRRWHHVWHRISKMYSMLGSSLNGMRVVKAFAQEEREIDRFRARNRQVFAASYAANAFQATYWPMLSLLMSVGSYVIWIFGGYKVLHGVMTVGTLTAFNAYLGQFYAPFQNFSRVLDWSTRSLTAAERVFEVLDTEPDVAEAADAVPMPLIKGSVEFENVGFSYDKGKRVLDDFHLKVEPGEMIGLVGHSGAGKSTIMNLLARFYDVNEGTIRIDGVDLRKIRQSDFRQQLGIVLQEPFLFPGTIRDNIAYAKPGATVEEVLRAAKAANCHEFILKFPDGYDTQVGERGQRLSGGERQRISIARAILHNPRILILDEATASVDTETEKQIQEAISRLIRNRTTFAIAHRLSTLRNASRLVVMKDGKMTECGTHDELMEKDGVYAGLVKVQMEVNKIRAL